MCAFIAAASGYVEQAARKITVVTKAPANCSDQLRKFQGSLWQYLRPLTPFWFLLCPGNNQILNSIS